MAEVKTEPDSYLSDNDNDDSNRNFSKSSSSRFRSGSRSKSNSDQDYLTKQAPNAVEKWKKRKLKSKVSLYRRIGHRDDLDEKIVLKLSRRTCYFIDHFLAERDEQDSEICDLTRENERMREEIKTLKSRLGKVDMALRSARLAIEGNMEIDQVHLQSNSGDDID